MKRSTAYIIALDRLERLNVEELESLVEATEALKTRLWDKWCRICERAIKLLRMREYSERYRGEGRYKVVETDFFNGIHSGVFIKIKRHGFKGSNLLVRDTKNGCLREVYFYDVTSIRDLKTGEVVYRRTSFRKYRK